MKLRFNTGVLVLIILVGVTCFQGCDQMEGGIEAKAGKQVIRVGDLLTRQETEEFITTVSEINKKYFSGESDRRLNVLDQAGRDRAIQDLVDEFCSDMDEPDEIEQNIPYPHRFIQKSVERIGNPLARFSSPGFLKSTFMPQYSRFSAEIELWNRMTPEQRVIVFKRWREIGISRWEKNRLEPKMINEHRRMKSSEEYQFEKRLYEEDKEFRRIFLEKSISPEARALRLERLEKRRNIILILAANMAQQAEKSYILYLVQKIWDATPEPRELDVISGSVSTILSEHDRKIVESFLKNIKNGSLESYLTVLVYQLGPPLGVLIQHGARVDRELGLDLGGMRNFRVDEIAHDLLLKSALSLFIADDLERILDPARLEAIHTHGAVFLPPRDDQMIDVYTAEKYGAKIKEDLLAFNEEARAYLRSGAKVHSWDNYADGTLTWESIRESFANVFLGRKGAIGSSTLHLKTPVEEEQTDAGIKMLRTIDRVRQLGATREQLVQLYLALSSVYDLEQNQIDAVSGEIDHISWAAMAAPVLPVIVSLLPALAYEKSLELLFMSFSLTYGSAALDAIVETSVADASISEAFAKSLRAQGPAALYTAPFFALLPVMGKPFNLFVARFFVARGVYLGVTGADRCLTLLEEVERLEKSGASQSEVQHARAEAVKAGFHAAIDVGFSFLMNWQLSREAVRRPEKSFSKDEVLIDLKNIKIWRETFSSENFPYIPKLNNIGFEYFRAVFLRLPPEIQSVLAKLPTDQAKALQFLSSLKEQLGLKGESFFSNIRDMAERGQVRGLLDLQTTKVGLPDLNFETSVNELLLMGRVRAQWPGFFSVNVNTEIQGRTGHGIRVTIGEKTYLGEIQSGEVVLEVPRSQVGHPNWNPLNPQAVIQYLQEGQSARPSNYPVYLGLDGIFYLMDGNHRFSAFEGNSVTVRVRLPYPLRSVSLMQHIDLVGGTQPTSQMLADLYQNKLGILEFLRKYQPEILRPRWIEEIIFTHASENK